MKSNNTGPLVSVLMTAFNREKYIHYAIESVLVQSYKNWELIILDDNSTDDTVAIARSFEYDTRIKVYVNEKNLGDYPNRNKAASLAKGKYLKYCDADDFLFPRCLETFVFLMEKFPEAAVAFTSPLDLAWVAPVCLSPEDAFRAHYLGPGLFTTTPTASFIRKSIFDQMNGFQPLPNISDALLWFKICGLYSTVLAEFGLVAWRSHGEQEFIYGSHKPDVLRQHIRIMIEPLMDSDCLLNGAERRQALHNVTRNCMIEMLKDLFKFRWSRSFNIWRSIPKGTSKFRSLLQRGSYPYRIQCGGLRSTPNWDLFPEAKLEALKNE